MHEDIRGTNGNEFADYPSFLAIFLTTRCNLRCMICRREEYRGVDLQFENIFKLEKAIRQAEVVDLTGWGEALVYPRFQDVLEYILSVNRRDNLIHLTTNGTRLSEELGRKLDGHLDQLIVSLNAATADTYNREMQGGNFDVTTAHVASCMGAIKRDHSRTNLHMVAHAKNYMEIPEFIRLAYRLGAASISVGQYLVSIPDHYPYALLHVKDAYMQVLEEAVTLGRELGVEISYAWRFPPYVKRRTHLDQCLAPYRECFVLPNGDVGPCCYSGGFIMGNAYLRSFEEVWFGETYRKLRRQRFLPACEECALSAPTDYRAHFTADFKKSKEFLKIQPELKQSELPFPDMNAHVQQVWRTLGQRGGARGPFRVAVFGAGQHTVWLEAVVRDAVPAPVVTAILDDRAKPEQQFWGCRPIRPEQWNPAEADAIILSTDATVSRMRERCRSLYGERIPTMDLYEGLPPGPYPFV